MRYVFEDIERRLALAAPAGPWTLFEQEGVRGIGAPFLTNHLRGRRSPGFACFSAFDFSILI